MEIVQVDLASAQSCRAALEIYIYTYESKDVNNVQMDGGKGSLKKIISTFEKVKAVLQETNPYQTFHCDAKNTPTPSGSNKLRSCI